MDVVKRYAELESKRSGLLSRCERYAGLTIRSVLPPDNYDTGQDELKRALQSIGSQCVNNLVNKMVMSMFAPSRPFVKFESPERDKEAKFLEAIGMSMAEFEEVASSMETSVVKLLDSLYWRPKLYDLLTHLVVTGNALRLTEGNVMRIISLRNYVVKRNYKGELIECIIKEDVVYEELDEKVKLFLNDKVKVQEDDEVSYYRWWKYDGANDKFIERQYVEDVYLNVDGYMGKYRREDLPVYHHVLRLVDKADYGIGLVEDNIDDFEGLEDLSESEINGAILASEFRWAINPASGTRVEDFVNSDNGDVVTGNATDFSLISAGSGVANAVAQVSMSAEKYVRRLGMVFLMQSSVQRDAERVTAEEIRLLANELESSLGGVYSRLAIDLQLPIARDLLARADSKFDRGVSPIIVTGLEALSRAGDLEKIREFVGDVVQITSMPEEVKAYLKLDTIFTKIATGLGLQSSEIVNTQEEVDARREQEDQRLQEQQAQALQMEQNIRGE